MDRAARRSRLAARLPEIEADGFLVTRLPNVRYLTGFSGSNGQLVLTPSGGTFLTDGRYEEQSRREVPDLDRRVQGGQVPAAVIAVCREVGITTLAFEADDLTYAAHVSLRDGGLALAPASGEVERLRVVKDREEVRLIEAAQAIADDAFEAVADKASEGMTERQIAFELDTFMREGTADGLAFDTIVAFGENGAEPHHHPTDRPLARGDLVKMDFGCVVEGYHSDMTRTFAFGEPTVRMREVYEVVRAAQQAGVEAVRAGVTGGAADAAARTIIADAGYGDAFKHPLGHGVGLEIHEAPWPRPGSEEPLPEGAVVTVEPGIYLDGIGGVRIEDMVEVTATGCRVIPRSGKDFVVL